MEKKSIKIKRSQKIKLEDKSIICSKDREIVIDKKELNKNKTFKVSEDRHKNIYRLEIKGILIKHNNKYYKSILLTSTSTVPDEFNILVDKKQIMPPTNELRFETEPKNKFLSTKRPRKDDDTKEINPERKGVTGQNLWKRKPKVEQARDMDNSNYSLLVSCNENEIIISKSVFQNKKFSQENLNKEYMNADFKGLDIIEIDKKILKNDPRLNINLRNLKFMQKSTKTAIKIQSALDKNFPQVSQFSNFANKSNNSKISQNIRISPVISPISKYSFNNSHKSNFLNKNKIKFNSTQHMNVDFEKNLTENFTEFCDLNSSNLRITESFPIKSLNLVDEEEERDTLNIIEQRKSTILSYSNSNNHNLSKDEEFVVKYDYKSSKGNMTSIFLYENDFHTLDDTEYLNDNIILFYLKFIENDMVSKELQGRFVIFDTLFYVRLEKEEDGSLFSMLKNYDSVKNWTKKMRIFDSDYLILPINENNEHWSLIIITYPGRMKNIFDGDAETKNIIEVQENQQGLYPTIIYLDSFYENNKKCVNIMKKYLFYEYATKIKNVKINPCLDEFIASNHHKVTTYVPYVPKQNNTYDCGIYLLAYSELFLYEPEFLLNKLKEQANNMEEWFNDNFIKNKRKVLQQLLINMYHNQKNRENSVSKNEIVNQFKLDRENLLQISYRQQSKKEIDLLDSYNLLEFSCFSKFSVPSNKNNHVLNTGDNDC